MKPGSSIPVFVALNFVLGAVTAGVAALLGIACYVDVTNPSLTATEWEEMVAGVTMVGVPCLMAGIIFVGAAIGLLRRSPLGYCLHLMGAGIAALSCVGVVYTIFAIRFAARESVRDVFFASGGGPGFAPVFTAAASPSTSAGGASNTSTDAP